MKKLVAFAAVIAAVSFTSCGNKSEQAGNQEAAPAETPAAEVAPAQADSSAVAETAAPADSVAVEAAPAE